MKKVLTFILVLVLTGITQATIVNNCDDIDDGAWATNSSGWVITNEPSAVSLDGCIKGVGSDENSGFSFISNSSWDAGMAVTTADTISFDYQYGGPDFKLVAYMGEDWHTITLRDYSWGQGGWAHVSYNFTEAGVFHFAMFNVYPAGYPLYIDNLVVTPEPATMSLLGLAGLFVVRRKK